VRRIFIKIYLCFLLALVLVIAAQLVLDFLTDSGPFRAPQHWEPHSLPPEFGHHGHPRPPPVPGDLQGTLAFRLIILFTVSGLVCYWFARYLTSPVAVLREATRRFASGDLKARVGKNTGGRKDEISDLGDDFDMMAERIESLMTVHRQLLGDISHELRSPLTRLYLALELAKTAAGTTAERELQRIEQEAASLNHLIGQILTLTRIENGIETVHMTTFDLSDLVCEIAANADFEANGVNRSVKFGESGSYTVRGNRELLRRAIENVIRNAIRHTPENTAVHVGIKMPDGAAPDGTRVIVSVIDHGPGVPDSEIQNIFRPFYRISGARERQTGGIGLGLAITERAVRLHGGAVTASNSADGGLVVAISLPLDCPS
jgi:signal transduction histidine kinase